MRDRLIELINDMQDKGFVSAKGEDEISCHVSNKNIADHLLANGVIVPPCKVGDTVYVDCKTWRSAYLWVNYPHTFIKEKYYIVADVVAIVKTRKQTLVKLVTYNQTTFTREYERYPISAIGKTVFLTREEAEQALKGGAE